MESVNTLLLTGFIAAAVVAIYFALTRRKRTDDGSLSLIKKDLDNVTENISQLKDHIQKQVSDRLDKSNAMMRESIKEQFAESAKIIGSVTKELTELKETGKSVKDVANDLRTLQSVLTNPKQRGVLGEYYLQTVLENVLPEGSFQMQYRFKDGATADAVVFLDRGKIIPIDSKFSLENYNRLIDTDNKAEKDRLKVEIKNDLKKRIDETSKYIRPDEDTLDIAFMFIPSEAIYYDLLINKVGEASTSSRDLIEYAFRDKKVIIVSPTTLLAYLQTVLQGLRSLKIEETAKEIQKRVGQLGQHLAKYDDVMHRLGNSLGTTVNHYNVAHKELGKIDKDVVRIAETDPSVEPLILDRPREDD